MLRQGGVLILLVLAIVATVLSIVGDGSYSDLEFLKQTHAHQERKNQKLREQVTRLQREVNALQHDDRAIEKAARNELGMARPDEVIVFFEDSKPASEQ